MSQRIRYAPLMSPEAIEKLTRDHAYQARRHPGAEIFAPPPDQHIGIPGMWTGVEDFPYHGQLHRDWTKRQALLEAQNHRCAYCGIRLRTQGGKVDNDFATIDHVVPKVARGLAVWSNEVMACWLCNTGRGAMFAMRYFKKVQEVGRWLAYRWGCERQQAAALANRPPETA